LNNYENSLVEQGRRERVDRSAFYKFSQVVSRPFLRLLFRHESHGLENIPDETGAVVATNHASNLDPPLVGADVDRPLFTMAKQSLHETPVLGTLIRGLYSFPVRRGVLDTTALRTAVTLLEHDNLVLMFPEGTRTTDGKLQEPRPGVGKIVAEAEVPVVPGYVKGSYDAWPKGQPVPKPRSTSVHFGEPIRMPERVKDADGREDYEAISGRIIDEIRNIKNRVDSTSQEGTAYDG
jgi:1-acyl-sn-glycerol-3-phosphate acyltransferase